MSADILRRLPPPTALLLIASILNLASANAVYPLPRQTYPPTVTVAHHALAVVAWPPAPTSPPIDLLELRRRQEADTICGYIGGNSALPATCGAGSHCVLDTENGVVGCCPDADATCTTGVFTGCVDGNSSPQTEVNPYVFTCQGANVCYTNMFEGGFSQVGCGTASDLATTVLASATGITESLSRPTISVSLTKTPSILSSPTTLGTRTSTGSSTTTSSLSSTSSTTSSRSSTSSKTSSTSTSSTSSRTSSSTTSSTTTSGTAIPAAPSTTTTSNPVDRTGAIIGGTISGVAVLIGLVALGVWYWRRRKNGNTRTGPGGPSGSTQYISPMTGGAFSALPQSQEVFEAGQPFGHMAHATAGDAYPPNPDAAYYPAGHNSYPPAEGFHYPGGYQQAYPQGYQQGYQQGYPAPSPYTAGAYGAPGVESDQVPLTYRPREVDDFATGFNAALERIGEEDESQGTDSTERLPVNEGNGVNGAPGGAETGGAMRPLWQQNRRQSRNLMWM